MTETDTSKRSFFRKMTTAVGFVVAADYLRKLMPTHSDLIDEINTKSASDVNLQKKAWLQKQLVAMTDSDKKQMLNEILDSHNNNHA